MSFGHSMRNTASIAACVADCTMRQAVNPATGKMSSSTSPSTFV